MQKNKIDKTELFETCPVPKAVMNLVVPMMVASVVMVLYNLADTFFVGMVNDPIETGAVTLASPVLLAFNAVINLFGVGGASLISRALGVKDHDTVKKTSAVCFYGAIIAAALFSLVCTVFKPFLLQILGTNANTAERTGEYLFWTVTCGAIPSILNLVTGQIVRSEGMSLHASIGSMSGCILNIILDPIFILPWGLNMGAAGAGCATFISNCVAVLYFVVLFIVKRGSMIITIDPRYFRPTWKILKEVFTVGVPAAIQNLLNVTGTTVLNNFVAPYGAEAVSAMGIAHKIALVPLYVAMGIGSGVMPLVGYNYSSGNRKRMKDALIYTFKFALLLMIVTTVLYCVFSENIIRLFMENEKVVMYGSAFLIGQSLAQPFFAIDFLGVGVYQACGMGGKSLFFAILRKIVLEIPAMFILNRLFPLYGLAYAVAVTEFVISIVAVFMLKGILKEKE